MYCFHCGKTMRLIDGVLTCTAGQMPLSANLQGVLRETFPAERFPCSVRAPLKLSWAPGIFCPGCGVELSDWVCPKCSTHLKNLAFAIVELHPHWYPGQVNWGIPLISYEE
jgi:hypothetical protein